MNEHSVTDNVDIVEPAQKVIVEDDWSSIMLGGDSTMNALNGFAEHDLQLVLLPQCGNANEAAAAALSIKLHCVTELTPLDMINLSCGSHDATGHRIWMGAEFFVYALAASAASDNLMHLFAGKYVMELGCGTGFSGIALMKLLQSTGPDHDKQTAPLRLVLTDGDSGSVDLCRRNQELNLPDDTRVSTQQLEWIETDETLDPSADDDMMFDTILATDVIYDAGAIVPLLRTAKKHLRGNGTFVLSLIPRCSIPGNDTKIASSHDLETYISQEAASHGLAVDRTIRQLSPSDNFTKEQRESLTAMEDVGAALLLIKGIEES